MYLAGLLVVGVWIGQVSWCPPCGARNDGFRIWDGLYRDEKTWEVLLKAGLGMHCGEIIANCPLGCKYTEFDQERGCPK